MSSASSTAIYASPSLSDLHKIAQDWNEMSLDPCLSFSCMDAYACLHATSHADNPMNGRPAAADSWSASSLAADTDILAPYQNIAIKHMIGYFLIRQI